MQWMRTWSMTSHRYGLDFGNEWNTYTWHYVGR